MTLKGVHYVHSGDCLPLGVLGVGDGVTNDVLQEDLEHTTGLLVDETRDTLDSATASQTTDSGLGNTLDVITQDFTVKIATVANKLSFHNTEGAILGVISYS